MNPEGARLGQNTGWKGAVLGNAAFACRGQSPVVHAPVGGVMSVQRRQSVKLAKVIWFVYMI